MSGSGLYYVVGASGAGKDSVIRYARDALGDARRVAFARRYITRPQRDANEDHIPLTREAFLLRKAQGAFAMDWESHGFHYGIGVEIDAWLADALAVVVNGSRSYIPAARARYPRLTVVWITARPETLAARLVRRGRETHAQIAARLTRNARLGARPSGEELHIHNEGPLQSAGSRFVELLSRHGAL